MAELSSAQIDLLERFTEKCIRALQPIQSALVSLASKHSNFPPANHTSNFLIPDPVTPTPIYHLEIQSVSNVSLPNSSSVHHHKPAIFPCENATDDIKGNESVHNVLTKQSIGNTESTTDEHKGVVPTIPKNVEEARVLQVTDHSNEEHGLKEICSSEYTIVNKLSRQNNEVSAESFNTQRKGFVNDVLEQLDDEFFAVDIIEFQVLQFCEASVGNFIPYHQNIVVHKWRDELWLNCRNVLTKILILRAWLLGDVVIFHKWKDRIKLIGGWLAAFVVLLTIPMILPTLWVLFQKRKKSSDFHRHDMIPMVVQDFSSSGGKSTFHLFATFLSSILEYLSRNELRMRNLSAFLLSNSVTTVFSCHDLHFWQNLPTSTINVCNITGVKQLVPLCSVNHFAFPTWFTSMHLSMLLHSKHLFLNLVENLKGVGLVAEIIEDAEPSFIVSWGDYSFFRLGGTAWKRRGQQRGVRSSPDPAKINCRTAQSRNGLIFYSVQDKRGPVAYMLELPPTSRIHPVFHVSMLKKFQGNEEVQCVPLPEGDNFKGPVLQPQQVLDSREILRDGIRIPQVLVQWELLPREEATWLDSDEFQKMHKGINHEDMVFPEGEVNDMAQQTNDSVANAGMEARPKRQGKPPQWLNEYDVASGNRRKADKAQGNLKANNPLQMSEV